VGSGPLRHPVEQRAGTRPLNGRGSARVGRRRASPLSLTAPQGLRPPPSGQGRKNRGGRRAALRLLLLGGEGTARVGSPPRRLSPLGGGVMFARRRRRSGDLLPHPCGTRGGVAAVELALVLPVLMFLFLVAVDYSRLFHYAQMVSNCARNG